MMFFRLSRAALVSLFVSLAFTAVPAQKSRRPAKERRITVHTVLSPARSAPQKRRLEAFATAWSTIDQRYFDKTFGGLDWNSIRAEYEPKVRAAKTDAAFHRLLDEMINRLGKSHLSVIVPEYFEKIEVAKKQAKQYEKRLAANRTAAAAADDNTDEIDEEDDSLADGRSRYGIGVELRMVDKQLFVSSVEQKSGAVLAGLKPGYIIEKINGVSVGDMIDTAIISGTSLAEIRYLFPVQLVESFLNGDPETSVQLSVIDENDKPKEITVRRLRLAGETVSISQNFPEQFLRFESRSLGPDLGYIKFNAFAVPVIEKFCESLTELRDKKAVIVDLRGNLGGVLGSMIGLSGMLSDKPLALGTVVSRTGHEPFAISPKVKQFRGRIVFLVDELSMSAAEIFVAGMQGNNRAVVVGSRTGGQSLPSIWTKLSTGAVLLYPIADFITPKGISLEGVGLEPDVKVELSRRSLLAGVDTQLARAETVALTADPAPPKPAPAAKAESTISESAPAPPPPPAVAKPSLAGAPPPKALTLSTAPPPPVPAAAPSDARSLKVLADFTTAVGGSEAFSTVTAYDAKGSMAIGPKGKAETFGTVYTARQFPDKYVMVLNTPAAGEVRESYNGKASLLQTDAGIERPLYQAGSGVERSHMFAVVFSVVDPAQHKNLKYEGEFEIEGRKRHIITGRDAKGFEIGMSFDSATKMLTTYTVGPMLYTFTDYRKAGSIHLPFAIELENFSVINFETVNINPKLDPTIFEKKEKCFDKAL